MAWGKAGSTTLSSSADDCDVIGMTKSNFNQAMFHKILTGSNASITGTLNNNTSSVYSRRGSDNGGGDFTSSGANWNLQRLDTSDEFDVIYLADISGEETLGIMWNISRSTAGAGTAPERKEQVLKFASTTDVTRFDINNNTSGSYDTDTNLTVLGSDLTPASAESVTVQDGAIFEETDTNKEYVLYDSTWTEL